MLQKHKLVHFTWIAVTVDLSAAVRQLVDLYQPAMDERHHELIVDLEDHVVVDADRSLLNRVLSNLIENEIAHLPAGCQIAIRLRSQEGSATSGDRGQWSRISTGDQPAERLNVSSEGNSHTGMVSDLLLWMRLYGHTAALPRSPIVQQAVPS